MIIIAKIIKILLIVINCPGGVNGDQFISSLEQFDKSGNSWNVPLRRDWRIINQVNMMSMVITYQSMTMTIMLEMFIYFNFRF